MNYKVGDRISFVLSPPKTIAGSGVVVVCRGNRYEVNLDKKSKETFRQDVVTVYWDEVVES